MNNRSRFERVNGFVTRAPKHASIVAGGSPVSGDWLFISPTVVARLHQDDEMIQNEIFGPVITVQQFSDETEDGVQYGLASLVWTRDHGRVLRFARDLDFGCVWINTHSPGRGDAPRRL